MKNSSAPKALLSVFKWFCKPDYHADIEGDLLELYERKVQSDGKRKANWLLLKDILLLFRPGIIRPVIRTNPLKSNGMYKHYIKIGFRNILKHKVYSSINIMGLVIGMLAVLMLAKYVGFFVGYDGFHEQVEQIFVIQQEEKQEGKLMYAGKQTYNGVAEFAKENYPEILEASRYGFNVEMLITTNGKEGEEQVKFNEQRIYTVDSSFFNIFSFEFLQGDPATALSQPGSVVLTASTAKKYFGEEDAVGEFLQSSLPWGEKHELQVTGVIQDTPLNSTFSFDFLQTSVGKELEGDWLYPDMGLFVLLDPSAQPKLLGAKISADISSLEEFTSIQKELFIELKPIKGNLSNTEYLLALVGVFMLVITWINFINLTGANALNRFKEMGVRKVLGSLKSQIVRQFVLEGLLLNGLALVLVILAATLLFPAIKEFANGRILPLLEWDTQTNSLFLLVFFFGSIASSAYPAIVLSKLHPMDALKGRLFNQTTKVGFRKVLVVFQFSLSMVLIIGIFIISDQMKFMQNHDLGFELDRTLIVKTAKKGWRGKSQFEAFKTEVGALSVVEGVASSTMVPGGGNGQDVVCNLQSSKEGVQLHLIGVDEHYMDNYQLHILAGKGFSEEAIWKNKRGVIINKAAFELLGLNNLEEALTQKIVNQNNGKTYDILAVIDNYHHQSLKEKIHPLLFEFNPFRGHTSIKLAARSYQDYDNLALAIQGIEDVWESVYPDQYFDYYFLDDRFNSQYEAETNFRKIFGVFTGISIFVACLGLFGLSVFVSLRRKKEVGVRKTFGASSIHILGLFIKEYLGQIILAAFLGAPIAYFLMHKWLENYSFRASIGIESFLLPILLLTSISLLCIAYQTVKAAFTNPTETLQNE
ncbi:FtsX-like permease family protein [Flammeovirgaceae bacterium SG7u.111]|nr:FtsX-like permease family protein [Flammeovirgaceae bacterium SG7u.132]WPO37136.1 FtsX-like permease family protein [Flammeovirgaceae bacterium SG7u.111]